MNEYLLVRLITESNILLVKQGKPYNIQDINLASQWWPAIIENISIL